jgi:hypothetical protein
MWRSTAAGRPDHRRSAALHRDAVPERRPHRRPVRVGINTHRRRDAGRCAGRPA